MSDRSRHDKGDGQSPRINLDESRGVTEASFENPAGFLGELTAFLDNGPFAELKSFAEYESTALNRPALRRAAMILKDLNKILDNVRLDKMIRFIEAQRPAPLTMLDTERARERRINLRTVWGSIYGLSQSFVADFKNIKSAQAHDFIKTICFQLPDLQRQAQEIFT